MVWSIQPLTLNQIIDFIETATDEDYGEQTLRLRALDEGFLQSFLAKGYFNNSQSRLDLLWSRIGCRHPSFLAQF